ncbi:PA14 domain-containing protein [Ideonella sp. DXS29W]|uniref:PA14 domain-containing protein n=1 Tax=Ideonella lacteola TaxID=2984193 RepID=A0ABU9BUF5_9BURK
MSRKATKSGPTTGPRSLVRAAGATLGAVLASSMLLVACGGGADESASAQAADSAPPASANRHRQRTAALHPRANLPADAAHKGVFSPLYNWPLIAIHAVLLPDGRVMTYGTKPDGQQTGYFNYDVWDSTQAPDAGHLTLPNMTATDLFCSSQVLVPLNGNGSQPQVVISNGDNWVGDSTTNTGNSRSSIFDPLTNTLSRGADTRAARWYASSTVLLNGEVYLQGGWGGTDHPEIRGVDGSYRMLPTDTSALDFYYPRNFVAPDGRLFGFDSGGRMYYIDPASGAMTAAGQIGDGIMGTDATAAMFRPGRILQLGGFSNQSIVIDINGGAPVLSGMVTMSSQRRLATATVLADGQVLATGGSPVWNDATNAALNAEIWNPQTGNWTVGASGAVPRLYHSTALLLPDATVLVAGGGAPGPVANLNAEIYHPPYLFTADGQWAERPSITGAPDSLQVGKTIAIDVQSTPGIGRVVLVKTGSVTHGWNMDQRFVELPFRAEGSRLYAQMPARAADVPPGYYMLFVLDAAGVPSKARILNLGVAPVARPDVTPLLAEIASQQTPLGSTVNLALSATDPNGDTLHFSAAGLPTGLTIDPDTGRITGSPTTAGNFDVTVAVSDGYNTASRHLLWQVSGSVPLQMEPVAAPGLTMVGSELVVTAAASGYQVQYKWNFGDGTAETDWSTDGHASHVYTRAGLFTVTVTVRDGAGGQVSQGLVQRVQMPVSGALPTQSTSLLADGAQGGAARLWVANADSGTVSVFDATTRNKLAEIAVGPQPRTLARAADGRIWVTNQRGGSLSIIDPASLTVVATVMMPRASQPHGIVMSPSGQQAYVSLSATGQVMKLDTASMAQTGLMSVGPQPTGLAVSGDGLSLYVSRFVSAPLPGESTAVVSPTASTGAEVWVVNTAAMNLVRTIVLQHSDKVDAENQGRGLPNYLGAAALSPDGSQAFVPSKQDNVLRGQQRDGLPLNFQNTVRAISSRVVLATGQEDLGGRIDHDNAGVASSALFDPSGVLLFVALETSREVAVLDAHSRQQVLRLNVGRTPRGLALSPDGLTLFVSNEMDRSISAFDLRPLIQMGQLVVPPLSGAMSTVAQEPLSAQVLLGKQLFNDARDPRLARDGYMSCASCHRDGGSDGRTWDLRDAGEGLRNTIDLRGRAATGHGLMHWSGNFDELQDFEGQIRRLAGGTGLMSDTAYLAGTRSEPLGDAKSGISADLDALAAYVASLSSFEASPNRPSAGALSPAAEAGKTVFKAQNCAACHGGAAFTLSGTLGLIDIGTLKPTSGQRLGGPLTGIDVPTLRDVWATAPYLHDGSAATLEEAIVAHRGVSLSGADLTHLAAYLREIGGDEVAAPAPGSGLQGQYFNNKKLSGTPALSRIEAVDFNWGTAAPGPGVQPDLFSVRWTGVIEVPASGNYFFQTVSDDGVRLWVNGVKLVSNWTAHTSTVNTSKKLALTAGQRVPVTLEYFDNNGPAEVRLRWKVPGTTAYVAVPTDKLYTH